MKKFICIHGHFYQPPRENAWLEQIELQDSAHPYHDWNERVSAECYAPNTASRILDDKGVIRNIVNNYARISFNFGPTLLSWMELEDPATYEAILEADQESMKHFGGHGSALAQVYSHMIMPLANAKDKETQVIWGIRDFEHRFGRFPEGMWLAETAVDIATLEALASQEIQFTILAPRQAAAVRRIGEVNWSPVHGDGVDTRTPYRVNLPSGNSIVVFFYDGAISQSVAFGGLLNDGQKFAQALIGAFSKSPDPQLVHVATDGETYGHHHRRGDMALAFCLHDIEKRPEYELTNYAQFLEMFPPAYEAQIHENSSWSCVHGIERWRSDCGCNTGGNVGWNQKWRKPLREALDWLRDTVTPLYDREASKILKDPWEARNDYISVILKRNDDTIRKFMGSHCSKDIEPNKVFRLMEMQRHLMLMYTSCGWFFDEISGIETTQILQYACHTIQLANQVGGIDLEEEFMSKLAAAPSNLEVVENGLNAYKQFVVPTKTDLRRVGMHYAVSSVFEEDPESFPVFNYTTSNEYFVKREAGEQRLVVGRTRVRSNTTRTEKTFVFAVIYLGRHNIIGNLSLDMEPESFNTMSSQLVSTFEESRLGDVIGIIQTYFGPEKYTLWQLFNDEKRKVLDLITRQSLQELEDSLRRVYNRDYPLVSALANNAIPIPNAYRATFEYILNADLMNCFQPAKIYIKEFDRVMGALSRWGLKIEDPVRVARLAGESIFMELRRISAEKSNVRRVERLNRLFPIMASANLATDLYKSQNLYFEMSRELDEEKQKPEWMKQFQLLGDNLGVKVG